jgi:serine/threonine protein kinase/WD40 repeat protein
MAVPSPCPPVERLRQLLSGNPPGDDEADLIAHLDNCPGCQRTLEQLTGATADLLRAAQGAGRTECLDGDQLRRVLHELESTTALTMPYRPRDLTQWLQSLLQPAESPGAMGRLDLYEVTEVLGSGGMGVVLKALDPALKRWVAIKLLAPDLAGDRLAWQRFAREAQAAAAVRHPNVVTVFAVSEVQGLPYLVMEYVGGGSLQDYLDLHGPPDWHTCARVGAEIAAGLAAAHARGLIHRDIKPSNILLQNDGAAGDLGVAKISDFGLARAADEARLTRTGIVPGTPMYMAPEQALNEMLDHRADLFSLGSVLYALCTGREPFTGSSAAAVIRQVCEARPRPVRELNPAVPAWLAATVERLQAKRPADRFASAAAVAELLRYNLEHPDRPRQVPVPHRRRTRLLAAAAVAAFILVGGLALSESLHWTRLTAWGTPRRAEEAGLPLRLELSGRRVRVWAVAFAPDGHTLATGCDDGRLRLWDAASGESKGETPAHGGALFVVSYARDGKVLVSAGREGVVRFWDAATLQEQPPSLKLGRSIRRAPISPDDNTIAVTDSAEDIELWNLNTGVLRRKLVGHHRTIVALAFAPDGRTLAAGDVGGHIHLWDPATGGEQGSWRGDPLELRALVFAPDSQTVASAGTGDKDVKLWSVATHQEIGRLPAGDTEIHTLAFSPRGRFLAAGGRDGIVHVWDVASATVVATVRAGQGTIWAVAFSPDGRTLASAGDDLGKLWALDNLVDQAK